MPDSVRKRLAAANASANRRTSTDGDSFTDADAEHHSHFTIGGGIANINNKLHNTTTDIKNVVMMRSIISRGVRAHVSPKVCY
jgi:hypothetical protein